MNRSLFIPPLTRLLRNSCATDFSLTPGTKRKLSLLDKSIGCILLNDLRQVLPNSLKRPEVGSFCPTSSRTGMGIVSGFLLLLTLFSLKLVLLTCSRTRNLPGCSGNFSYSSAVRHSSSSIAPWRTREGNGSRTNLSQGMRGIVTLDGPFSFFHILVLHSQLVRFTCAERPLSSRPAVGAMKPVQGPDTFSSFPLRI